MYKDGKQLETMQNFIKFFMVNNCNEVNYIYIDMHPVTFLNRPNVCSFTCFENCILKTLCYIEGPYRNHF